MVAAQTQFEAAAQGNFSMRLRTDLVACSIWKNSSSWPFSAASSSFRSPPAKKVFLADANTTPASPSSASSLLTVAAIAPRYSSFIALTGPVISIVTRTMPSASFSYLNTLMMS
jgi:hypothetical protein